MRERDKQTGGPSSKRVKALGSCTNDFTSPDLGLLVCKMRDSWDAYNVTFNPLIVIFGECSQSVSKCVAL